MYILLLCASHFSNVCGCAHESLCWRLYQHLYFQYCPQVVYIMTTNTHNVHRTLYYFLDPQDYNSLSIILLLLLLLLLLFRIVSLFPPWTRGGKASYSNLSSTSCVLTSYWWSSGEQRSAPQTTPNATPTNPLQSCIITLHHTVSCTCSFLQCSHVI